MSENSPLVSFVVQCYNTEPFVADCIHSIFTQEGSYPWEIIAVDDCSSDNTVRVLETFKDPRLRVIRHSRNQGHAATVTEALGLCKGRYIAKIDSDDRYRTSFLSRTIPILDRYSNVGLVYGDAAIMTGDGVITTPRSDRHHGGNDFKGCELIALLQENFICAPTIIGRRECFLPHLPMPSHLAFHDWYFTVKIAREAEFYFVSAVLADYRVHSGNLHCKIILERTEEPSILWMLNQVYSSEERTEDLQRMKLRAKSRVYGRQYRTLADKYFGARMNADARRCYRKALRYSPGYMLDSGLMRRFCATLVGRNFYEFTKRLWKGRPTTAPASTGIRGFSL